MTRQEIERRFMEQIRHLLVENQQLHKELEECRGREELWITQKLSH